MRNILIMAATLIILAGCGGDDSVQILKNADNYFPMEPGDTWYYTYYAPEDTFPIVRQIANDTVLISDSCFPVLEDGDIAQCWTKDSIGLHINYMLFHYKVQPPLLIPFSQRSDEPYAYNSNAIHISNPDNVIKIQGTLTFGGYVNKTVPAGTFKNCIKLRYDEAGDYSETYYEYYASGVGLLDDGNRVLDSAFIDGVKYPTP